MVQRIVRGCAFALALALGMGAVEAPIDLSGHWRLNASLSDDPEAVMKAHRERMEQARGGGAGPPGGRRGGSGFGGEWGEFGQSGGGSDREGGQRGGAMVEITKRRATVTILQDDESGEMAIIDAVGDTLRVVPDGVAHERTTLVGKVSTTARWDGFSLVVNTSAEGKPSLQATYRITDDGRLEVIRSFSGPRSPQPIQVKSVYDEIPRGGG